MAVKELGAVEKRMHEQGFHKDEVKKGKIEEKVLAWCG